MLRSMPVVIVLFLTMFSGDEILYSVAEQQPLWGTVRDNGDPMEDCQRRGAMRGATMMAYARASHVESPQVMVECRNESRY